MASSALSEEVGHCSQHVYHSSGCDDCNTAVLYQAMCASRMMKAAQVAVIGTHPLIIYPTQHSPRIQLIKQQMLRKIYVFLVNTSSDVIKAMKKKEAELGKASKEDKELLFLAAYSAIQWEELVNNVTTDLYEATHSGGTDGLTQLQLSSQSDLEGIEQFARHYGVSRAAEMVGMKFVDNKLVENPEAKFTITGLTHDDLKDVIDDSLDKNLTIDAIQDEIKSLGIFSRSRAMLISDTEMSMAQFQGNLKVWKSSGLVKTVSVVVSDDHDFEDVCDEVVDAGPYKIEECPMLPLHPNCECQLVATELLEH